MSVTKVQLKVTPTPTLYVADTKPHQLLFNTDPFVVLGGYRNAPVLSEPIKPTQSSCFGPRGVTICGENGPLWIADTGHHRLLGWKQIPTTDNQPADWVIGQPDFNSEGRNAKAEVNASSFNVVTGICTCGEGLAVADAWNNRVLIYHQIPTDNNTPADVVLGQIDFHSNHPNQGLDTASASSFHWPYGVAYMQGKLLVADAKNRRVLVWNEIPTQNAQDADIVLGQDNFTCSDENGGSNIDGYSMCWPHDITLWRGKLCVADAGNNRIMVYDGIPNTNNPSCQFVLGQQDIERSEHNQALYWSRANTLNMPYAIEAINDWLIVADTANSRLLGWHIDDLKTNTKAKLLYAQVDFNTKGDNRWKNTVADSLCWPYGLSTNGQIVAVADSGNNRVNLWNFNL